MQTKRLSWIDIARGIGILLVVYGHALDGNSIRHLIYSFHMPLFFFLSGIVFHHKKYESFWIYLKKDVRRILIPYLIFAFLCLLWWFFLAIPENHRTGELFWTQFISIFYGNGSASGLAFNNLLWFLPCLFVTKLGFWILTEFVKHKKGIVAALVVFSLVGYAISIFYPAANLPFGLETACTAIVFFGVGYLWNSRSEGVSRWFEDHAIIIFLSLMVVCLTTATLMHHLYGRQIDLRLNTLQNYGLFYLASMSGVFSCFALSWIIHKNSVLEYLGRHSMPIFVWHLILFSYISDFILLFTSRQHISDWHNTILAPLYTIASVALIVIFMNIFKKKYLLKPLLRFHTQKEYA